MIFDQVLKQKTPCSLHEKNKAILSDGPPPEAYVAVTCLQLHAEYTQAQPTSGSCSVLCSNSR